METHDELALFEFLLKNEAFCRYRQKLEAMEQQLLHEAAFAKAPRDETIALKTAKGLRIAIDFVPKTIEEIKEELRAEAEQAEWEMEEAKKQLPLEYK